jgi:hypothetical protein
MRIVLSELVDGTRRHHGLLNTVEVTTAQVLTVELGHGERLNRFRADR